MKIPLFVEIFGEPEVGKTYLSAHFPKVLYLDTTAKREAYPVVRSVVGDEIDKRYVWVTDFNDIRLSLNRVKGNPDFFKTVVVDTSTDLQKLAIKEWLREHKGRERPLPFEYGEIRAKIDEFISEVMRLECNLVFTAQMKKEYQMGTDAMGRPTAIPTGKRIRDGYEKTPFMADLRIYLALKEEGGKYVRKSIIVKNRYRDRTDSNSYIFELPSYDWEGIKKLVVWEKGLKEDEIVE